MTTIPLDYTKQPVWTINGETIPGTWNNHAGRASIEVIPRSMYIETASVQVWVQGCDDPVTVDVWPSQAVSAGQQFYTDIDLRITSG